MEIIHRTSGMKIPFRVKNIEAEMSSCPKKASRENFPQFPFFDYEEFVQEKDNVLIWVNPSFSVIWKLCVFPEKLFSCCCFSIGVLCAAACCLAAIVLRDPWLLLGAPICLICDCFAAPIAGCINGFLPTVAAIIGFLIAIRVDSHALALVSYAAIFVWCIACFGKAIAAEVAFDAVKCSEAVLVWCLLNGKVEVDRLKNKEL